ncbi:MAG: hypothetical protein Q9228_002897 [Teloschistes exilis]
MPTLIAALAVGDEIFFSSQLKGTNGHDFVYESVPDVDIKNQLNLWYSLLNLKVNSGTEHSISQAYLISEADVKIPDAEKKHKNQACAEIMTVVMYMKEHNGQSLRTITGATNGQQAPTRELRVAVWGTTFGNDRFKTILLNPCKTTTAKNWGCGRLMEYQGISVVQINKYASRDPASWSDPPINEIEPTEVRAKGVPISDLFDGGDFSDRLDSD